MYSAIVFLHVLSVFIFLLSHGVSIVVFLMIRRSPGVERVRILMSLRNAVVPVMMSAFGVLVLSGVAAAFMGRWWSRGWTWASVGVLLVIFLTMGFLGRGYFDRIEKMFKPAKRVRSAVAAVRTQTQEIVPALRTQELTPVLANSHPRILATVGLSGLVIILYLMMYKPF